MNHGHDELDDVVMALARAGYEVQLGVNLAQSHHLAGQGRPDVVLMNALAACEGGAELASVAVLVPTDAAGQQMADALGEKSPSQARCGRDLAARCGRDLADS